MIRTILALCCLLVTSPAGAAPSRAVTGSWTASVSEDRSDELSFSLRLRRNQNNGMTIGRSEFDGLTATQIESSTSTPVRFELRREAGTVEFEGTFRHGDGAGQFMFTPNNEFPKTLRSLGMTFEAKHGDEDLELFQLALFDVSSAFIRSMQSIGYSVSLEKFVEFRIFGVNPAYVREMKSVGYDHLSADRLVETRIHGVTPDFVREVRRLGYTRASMDQLVAMRIHGVTPEFIRRVEAAGYRDVPIDKLVEMRIFDIEPEMVEALDRAGR